MALIDRVKRILLIPRSEWATIDAEPATVASLYRGYIIPLAAIPALAGFVGMAVIGYGGGLGGRFQIPMGTALTWAVVQYVGSLVGVYVLALIIDALAPSFGGRKDQMQALKVAAYSATASWLAGIFNLFPGLAVLGLLGLYSLYLLFLGLPVLMKAPTDKALAYTAIVIVAAVVVFLIIGAIASRAIGFGGWGPRPIPFPS